jgi:hypothetical protein
LEEHNARCGIVEPEPCRVCSPILVLVAGRLCPMAGAMCFACGLATGGTVASAQHRHEARGKMIARIAVLLAADDRGPELSALLGRCPPDVRERALARLAAVTPAIHEEPA